MSTLLVAVEVLAVLALLGAAAILALALMAERDDDRDPTRTLTDLRRLK